MNKMVIVVVWKIYVVVPEKRSKTTHVNGFKKKIFGFLRIAMHNTQYTHTRRKRDLRPEWRKY